MNWLLDPEVMTSPDFDSVDAVEIFNIVNRQDLGGMQASPAGDDFEGV